MVVVVREVGSWRWSLRWKMEMDRDEQAKGATVNSNVRALNKRK